MSFTATLLEVCKFNRDRTLATLADIEKLPDPRAALAFRPAPARAHIGWHLMHVAITEEIFATERLAPEKTGAWTEWWPRFRGGSTPDDDVPSPEAIRRTLTESREHLIATLAAWGDARLDEVPPQLTQRGWTFRTTLEVIAWHEPHHQGQAHAVLNLFKAQSA